MTPFIEKTNRFDVPPEYCLAWCNDFRPEDDQNLTGGRDLINVTRLADGRIKREFVTPLGPFMTVTTVTTPRWVSAGEQYDKKGRVVARWDVTEWVEPDGKGGTIHHAEISKPRDTTLKMKIMIPMMRPMLKKNLDKLFANAKTQMEDLYRSGKPATA
ncbi:MAG TPA: hypothetical protein VM370_11660 [Candidatus Thermoplasmatota archaeon]|nr:hypothetical protein [Candidatus Thermoplasmatota archaeon]